MSKSAQTMASSQLILPCLFLGNRVVISSNVSFLYIIRKCQGRFEYFSLLFTEYEGKIENDKIVRNQEAAAL